MDAPVLELQELSKTIGHRSIVSNVNLKIMPAEIFGFLGPNGAGKTTTIRMIAGLSHPTQGMVRICGFDVQRDFISAMSHIGCIIEGPDMYKYFTGRENLSHYAAMDKRIAPERIDEVVELVGLSHRIDDKVETYSLGMRQRLGIAQAIMSRPKLLILDEPTNGLDPAGIVEFRNLILRLSREEGMAVFVSSHILAEVGLMCDRVGIIRQGKMIKDVRVSELAAESGKTGANTLEELFLRLTEGDEIV